MGEAGNMKDVRSCLDSRNFYREARVQRRRFDLSLVNSSAPHTVLGAIKTSRRVWRQPPRCVLVGLSVISAGGLSFSSSVRQPPTPLPTQALVLVVSYIPSAASIFGSVEAPRFIAGVSRITTSHTRTATGLRSRCRARSHENETSA